MKHAIAIFIAASSALASSALAQTPPATPLIPTPGPARLSAEDYVEIQQLYALYVHALDKGEGALFASTFTVDGEFTGGRGPGHAGDERKPLKGRAALAKLDIGGTRHFNANLVVSPISATMAKASVYLLLYSARSIPSSFTETAIYDDTLEKTSEGWRFKKRVVWRDDDDITPFKPKPLPPGFALPGR